MADSNNHTDAGARAWTLQRWGGLTSLLTAAAFIVAVLLYFSGDSRSALGRFSYDLADFLSGPVWAAGLVTAVLAVRERIGERASRRMNVALLAAALAAAAMVGAACIRSSNRGYVLRYPELDLVMASSTTELAQAVVIVWTTIVAGVIGAARHFLAFAFVLIGWAGWTSRRLPRVLSILYLVVGIPSLFGTLVTGVESLISVLLPTVSEDGALLAPVVLVWQGIVLLKGEPRETQAPS